MAFTTFVSCKIISKRKHGDGSADPMYLPSVCILASLHLTLDNLCHCNSLLKWLITLPVPRYDSLPFLFKYYPPGVLPNP